MQNANTGHEESRKMAKSGQDQIDVGHKTGEIYLQTQLAKQSEMLPEREMSGYDYPDKAPARVEVREGAEKTAEGIVTAIPTIPVTQARKPFVATEDTELKNPGVPRANIAPSAENPHGTTKSEYAHHHQFQSVLQQHCAFFDRDNDYILWPYDTYIGFRRLGYNIFISIMAVFVIHGAFSYPSAPPAAAPESSWFTKLTHLPFTLLPDPFFRIWLDRIHKTKHSSDTATYDNEGRFIPQRFEDIFAKYSSVPVGHPPLGEKGTVGAAGGDGAPDIPPPPSSLETKKGLTLYDIFRVWKGQRCVMDPFGWTAEFLEWSATYLLLWPEDGIMRKEDIRRVYDGSIFWDIAEKIEMEKMAKRQRSAGGGYEGYMTADPASERMRTLSKEKDAGFS